MKSVNDAISTCRHCQFYRSEGRRGGFCRQLEVPVQGGWKSCSLAIAPFASTWEKLAEIKGWQVTEAEPQPTIAAGFVLSTGLPELRTRPEIERAS
ncbi:MAG: hypothetical protein MUF72_11585 [Elainella sp. Prado103]|nr:hypothetical protein [Elainella sp. Prado103]